METMLCVLVYSLDNIVFDKLQVKTPIVLQTNENKDAFKKIFDSIVLRLAEQTNK